jgi:anthranilate phosphoribosyltransferase
MLKDLEGGDAGDNAEAAWDIARGKGRPAVRDSVQLNAAAALVVYGTAEDIPAGLSRVRTAFDEGRVLAKMEEAVRVSHELSIKETV